MVVAALDATPDPVNGLRIYPGRGGSSGSRVPRRPGPITGAGAAPIPETPDSAYAMPTLVERSSGPATLVA